MKTRSQIVDLTNADLVWPSVARCFMKLLSTWYTTNNYPVSSLFFQENHPVPKGVKALRKIVKHYQLLMLWV